MEDPSDVRVAMLRVGVCGTDREVMLHGLGGPRGLPQGADYLVMGHEAVGRVVEVGERVTDLKVGDVVVPTVRRGCGECVACAHSQADLCYTGRIKERGIVGLHGFLSERIVERADHLVHVPAELQAVAPLVESLTTPEKAMRRIANARAHLPDPTIHRALVTGSGPIALLAVLMLRLQDLETVVLARQPADSLQAELSRKTGATYVELETVDLLQPQATLGGFDVVIEATGAAEMSVAMIAALRHNGVLDLVGGPSDRRPVPIQASALGAMVGRNLTVQGSVNANPDDWRRAVADLGQMRTTFPGVVDALITHRFDIAAFDEKALTRGPGQIKAVVDISE
jgi:threonine dehydrogenase-like Zn-dependent dehydrogenase